MILSSQEQQLVDTQAGQFDRPYLIQGHDIDPLDDYRLNIQAFARRHEPLASCLVPDEGNVLVSQDLGAGEPSVTAHYSKDPAYRYATLEGIGKEPFWKDGILWIDDIYLMVMSVSPIGNPVMRKAWAKDWSGKSFVEQWMHKPKVIKSFLDEDRQLHKMLALALGYSLGPNKMQTQVKQQFSKDLTFGECKELYRNYWELFGELRRFADYCQRKATEKGYLVNEFGYRLCFVNNGNRKVEKGPLDTTHKAYNYLIQSSVSGIMHLYLMFIMEIVRERRLPVRFVTVIHDEDVFECKKDAVDEFEKASKDAETKLNNYLGWSVPIRIGFTVGETFYHIK